MRQSFSHGRTKQVVVEKRGKRRVDRIAEQRADALATAVLADERPAAALNFACRKCDYYGERCIDQNVPDPLWILPRLSEKKFEMKYACGE